MLLSFTGAAPVSCQLKNLQNLLNPIRSHFLSVPQEQHCFQNITRASALTAWLKVSPLTYLEQPGLVTCNFKSDNLEKQWHHSPTPYHSRQQIMSTMDKYSVLKS